MLRRCPAAKGHGKLVVQSCLAKLLVICTGPALAPSSSPCWLNIDQGVKGHGPRRGCQCRGDAASVAQHEELMAGLQPILPAVNMTFFGLAGASLRLVRLPWPSHHLKVLSRKSSRL